MATLTIRNLDEDVKTELRKRAAARGVSMEQEAREVLRKVTMPERPPHSGAWRLKTSREEILALGRKPKQAFDLKALRDHMWDEGLL